MPHPLGERGPFGVCIVCKEVCIMANKKGFWGKVGDAFVEVLEASADAMSRPSYVVPNVLEKYKQGMISDWEAQRRIRESFEYEARQDAAKQKSRR
jgi:hypothetical protein